MTPDRNDPRIDILHLLQLREKYRGGPPPEMTEIVTALGSSMDVAKEACDALEVEGYIMSNGGFEKVRLSQGLSYLITDLGKWYLYQRQS